MLPFKRPVVLSDRRNHRCHRLILGPHWESEKLTWIQIGSAWPSGSYYTRSPARCSHSSSIRRVYWKLFRQLIGWWPPLALEQPVVVVDAVVASTSQIGLECASSPPCPASIAWASSQLLASITLCETEPTTTTWLLSMNSTQPFPYLPTNTFDHLT